MTLREQVGRSMYEVERRMTSHPGGPWNDLSTDERELLLAQADAALIEIVPVDALVLVSEYRGARARRDGLTRPVNE